MNQDDPKPSEHGARENEENHASAEKLAGIDRGLDDAEHGQFATEEEVRAAFAKIPRRCGRGQVNNGLGGPEDAAAVARPNAVTRAGSDGAKSCKRPEPNCSGSARIAARIREFNHERQAGKCRPLCCPPVDLGDLESAHPAPAA